MSEYGVPQNRKRVILLGLKKGDKTEEECQNFIKNIL